MKSFNWRLQLLLAVLMLALCTTGARAALQSVGPVDPVSTFPKYYQDTAGLALQICLDQNGFCLLPGGFNKDGTPVVPNFDPAFSPPNGVLPLVPITTTPGTINDGNFPDESFYYSAQAIMPIEAGELANLAFVLEAAFLSGVIPNTGITFLRTDLQKMQNLAPSSTYRVTHPYGQFTFTTDGAGNTTGGGGVAVRQEDPAGTEANWLPALMKSAAFTNIGPFLKPAPPAVFPTALVGTQTHTYLGDPAVNVLVTGSPTGNNFFRIERLNANGTVAATWQTDLFALAGRVFTEQIASPLTIDRAVYARDAVTGQIDVFVTALPGASLAIDGTGIAVTPLAQDLPNTGKFFAHLNLPTPATLPAVLNITNSLDNPLIIYPVTLVDEVKISTAEFNPVTRNLTIKADSRDNLAPLPTLTVPQFAAPNTLDASGTLIKAIPATTIPPMTVTVHSSKGGSDTIPISVVTQVPPPVAVNDSASTSKGAAVSVDVMMNDTTAGIIDPASVVIVASPASGATVVPVVNGSILYTPTAAFIGTETFAYTIKDTLGQVSNVATVTVTVNTPPVAGNDTATAVVSTTVNINVIANDNASNSVINSTTVNIVSPATCGAIAVLSNGTVNFTAPATTGTCSFSYVVSDTFVPPALSNVATVTVTVTSPLPPVALNDTATTITSGTTVINVIANDSSSPSSINPASIVVSVPTGGTAVANINGTVSYTAPAVAGTYTFTYTVKNNAVTPATSNVATVTVTVNPQFVFPTAVNDNAVLAAGSSAVINVAANDIAGTNPKDPASVAVVAAPAHGTAVANVGGAGTITYTPTVGYNGADSFTYNIKDTLGNVSATNATVSLTVTTPAPTETITVTRAQFTLSNASWRIDGTSNAPIAGQTMKIFNSATVPVDGVTGLLATVNVGGNGSFTWSSATGFTAPNALRRISILSSKNPNNNKVEQVTVTVR